MFPPGIARYNIKISFASHYNDAIMGSIASQITSIMVVYSTVYSDADQRKYQSSASLAFVWGIYRRPVNSPHKWAVTRKVFAFDDVIMKIACVPKMHHCGSVRQSVSLLSRLFGCRSKKTSKLRVTGLCAGNSPGTGEFPAQMASYAENVSIWLRHHGEANLLW